MSIEIECRSCNQMFPKRPGKSIPVCSAKCYIADKTSITAHDCWNWVGNREVYGVAFWNKVSEPAHRLSYRVFKGKIPVDHVVRHKCDNVKCVNPSHLETGSVSDNVRDRFNSPSKCNDAKLEQQTKSIRRNIQKLENKLAEFEAEIARRAK